MMNKKANIVICKDIDAVMSFLYKIDNTLPVPLSARVDMLKFATGNLERGFVYGIEEDDQLVCAAIFYYHFRTETAAYLEENKHSIHQMGPMDDLFFLVKTGRISNFKAFFGRLIGINPMADFNHKGLAQVLGKFKGKQAAFDATIEYMRATVKDPQNQIIFVAHSNREDAAKILAQRVQEEFSPKEIIINHVGLSCGASIGPGLCAVFYHGVPISEDMEQERALMNKIMENQKK